MYQIVSGTLQKIFNFSNLRPHKANSAPIRTLHWQLRRNARTSQRVPLFEHPLYRSGA
tara:strand:+ start:11166 stop:11339 length:174 start_codon:yes stop_codon:yes gene_type:complete